MRLKRDVSHNACSVFDYNTLRWNVQPSDMVAFDDRECGYYVGEIIFLTRDLMHVQRLKDRRVFVISLYDIRDWRVKRVDNVRRLPNGIFQVGERVTVDSWLNYTLEESVIDKFEHGRVKLRYFLKGRFVGWFFCPESDILKYKEKKNEKENNH